MYTSSVIEANRVLPPTRRPDFTDMHFEDVPPTRMRKRFPESRELQMPHYLMPDTFEDGLFKTDRGEQEFKDADANVNVLLEHQSKVNTKKNDVQQWLQENVDDPNICTCFPTVTSRLNPTMIYDEKKPCQYHTYIKPEEVYKFTHPWSAQGVRPRARQDKVAYDMLVVDRDNPDENGETSLSQLSKPIREVKSDTPGQNEREKVMDPRSDVPGTAPAVMKKNDPEQPRKPRYIQGATQQTKFAEYDGPTTPFIRVKDPTMIDHKPFVSRRHAKEDTRPSFSVHSGSNRDSVPVGTPLVKPGRKAMSYHANDDDAHLSKDIHESYSKQMKPKWERREKSPEPKLTTRKNAPTVSSPRRYYTSHGRKVEDEEEEEEPPPKPMKKREFVGEYVDPRTGKVYEFEVRHGRDSIHGNKIEVPR